MKINFMFKLKYITFTATVTLGVVFLVLVLGGPAKIGSAAQNMYNKWMILTMILDKIERFYVDPVDPDALLQNAINGMLSGLDPHSVYLPAAYYKSYSEKYGGYYGVGLKYHIVGNQFIVTALVDNGPAALAGIHVGDRILKIEGIPIADLNPSELNSLMSGNDEEVVSIEIQHENDKSRVFELPKRRIHYESVPAAFKLNETTGYIKIVHFTESTPMELDLAFADLNGRGMQQVLIDLRNNSGGMFNAGVSVADRFLTAGKLIVTTRGRSAQATEQYSATQRVTFPAYPLILLVNEATASDAEIVAGAIQDWDRGLVVGRRTYGKALVQTEYPFQDGSVLLLTTARYYTPLGRLIQREELTARTEDRDERTLLKYTTPKGRTVYGGGGIQPDVEISVSDKQIPDLLKKLYLSRENILFDFVQEYVTTLSEEEKPEDLDRYAFEYEVPDSLLHLFYQRMKIAKQGVNQNMFDLHIEDIKIAIKQEIALRLWGEQGKYSTAALSDEEIQKALNYFAKARELVSR